MKHDLGQFARPAVRVTYTPRQLATMAFQEAQADYLEAKDGHALALFGTDEPDKREVSLWAVRTNTAITEIRETRELHERGGVWW